jgi:5-methylcytosine-specific restriction protein A
MPTAPPVHRPRARAPKTHGWAPDSRRGSRQDRGYGAAWEALRLQVLTRDRGICIPCYGRGRYTRAVEVDHVLSKARGGSDDLANLQAICKACHRRKTELERRAPFSFDGFMPARGRT